MIKANAGWRYNGIIICVWNGLGLIITALFYFPPPRVNSKGKSRREILSEIDYIGGFLSISGLVLFMAGMQWGGYQVCKTISPSFIFSSPSLKKCEQTLEDLKKLIDPPNNSIRGTLRTFWHR